MENGWYGMDEVTDALEKLPYPKIIKDHIYNIAQVIQQLRNQPKTSGRNPASYLRIMKQIDNDKSGMFDPEITDDSIFG